MFFARYRTRQSSQPSLIYIRQFLWLLIKIMAQDYVDGWWWDKRLLLFSVLKLKLLFRSNFCSRVYSVVWSGCVLEKYPSLYLLYLNNLYNNYNYYLLIHGSSYLSHYLVIYLMCIIMSSQFPGPCHCKVSQKITFLVRISNIVYNSHKTNLR